MDINFCILCYKETNRNKTINIVFDDEQEIENFTETNNVNCFLFVNRKKRSVGHTKRNGMRYHIIDEHTRFANDMIFDFCISRNINFLVKVCGRTDVKFLYNLNDNKCYKNREGIEFLIDPKIYEIQESATAEPPKDGNKFIGYNKSATFAIVDFNTSILTNTLIKSIIKNIKSFCYNIVVFDNSDKSKFVLDPQLKNCDVDIVVYDNSNQQYIKFGPLIDKYIVDKSVGLKNNYGSFKHTFTIDYILTQIPEVKDNVILCDSDIIIKKDIDFIDETKLSIGQIIVTGYRNFERICPYLQYINKRMAKEIGFRYFNPQWAYGCSTIHPFTDTGYSMLKEIRDNNLPFLNMNVSGYYAHLKGASFRQEQANKIPDFIEQNEEFYNDSICFFTSVDKKYEKFIFPYVYFAHKFNPNSKFEFVVADSDERIKELKKKARLFSEKLKCEILIRKPKNASIAASKIRFVEEPEIKCCYTYCGDVDVMILENVVQYHISQMERYGTIFDNAIRYTDNRKLSGLHFVKTDIYYRLTEQARSTVPMKMSDEELLKYICEKSGLKSKPSTTGVTDFNVARPVHGFHLSPNRKPFKEDSIMAIDITPYHYKILDRILRNPMYRKMAKENFDGEFNDVMNQGFRYAKKNRYNEFDPKKCVFSNKDKKKYVIFTCNIGNYERQSEGAVYDTENFDYYYFTDNPDIKIDPQWKIIDISTIKQIFPPRILNDNTRKCRFIKTHPHLFFENYELSVWIDASMQFITKPSELLEKIDKHCIFTSVKHPHRKCIYQEAVTVMKLKKDDELTISDTVDYLKHNLYPTNNGLVESGVIIRNHNNQKCIMIMEQWWQMIEGYSKRDQLSFDYICWRNKFPYNAIPCGLRKEHIKLSPHKK